MMYIGTSLGGCLNSLMANEVSEDDVMFIVTRTLCPTYDTYLSVVEQYYVEGTPISRFARLHKLGEYDLTAVKDLATRLYFSGKIHQPRVFVNEGDNRYSYINPLKLGHGLWVQVVPTNDNSTPAVMEAWEKYKMLDNLTK
jgi:hypothetical protein